MSGSYHHRDEKKEWKRLIRQFRRDWQSWEKEILGELGIQPNLSRARILIYGCGIGIDAKTFLDEGYGTHVEGWDANANSIREATTRYANPNLTFRTLDLLEELPPPNIRLFTMIVLRLVLQHVPFSKVPTLLENCLDLLEEGGYLVLHDVDRDNEVIVPPDHEFNEISTRIRDFQIRRGTEPAIGRTVIKTLERFKLKNVKSRVITIESDFEETVEQLSFSPDVVDKMQRDQKLIPSDLWEAASKNKVRDFKRTTFRIMTVAEK